MLDQIMKMASNTGLKQFEALDRVTQNVANMQTNGYKAKRFEQYMRPDGLVDGVDRVNTSQGDVMMTKRELDIAIKGPGYLPVTTPDGTIAYTRDGSLTKNGEGYLITQFGDLVGHGIQLPSNYKKLLIEKNGEVKVLKPGEAFPQTVGKLELVTFDNPEALKTIGYNKVVPTSGSGNAIVLENPDGITQGGLERANINMYHQIDQVLRLNAGVLSNMKILKFVDEIYRQAANLRQ